ncbi:uncharacterized protein LOC116348071 [Contarinia nasturtii]|uniref:uncharacterized protein LOC116348071 n=1 Tax=Contarinia nasturtii TaxID=265458 RepID=UPI0012D3BF59|nr:uncharacterized protein LOC116348071 [Contarinia nasturtii]
MSMQQNSMLFFCNCCMIEAKLFQDATPNSGPPRQVHKWFWTNCQHILCYRCRTNRGEICACCKKNAKFMEISRKMPKIHQLFFEKTSTIKNSLVSVAKFGKNQNSLISVHIRARFLDIRRRNTEAIDTMKKFNAMKKIYHKTRIIHRIIAEYIKQRREIKEQRNNSRVKPPPRHSHPNRHYEQNHSVSYAGPSVDFNQTTHSRRQSVRLRGAREVPTIKSFDSGFSFQ